MNTEETIISAKQDDGGTKDVAICDIKNKPSDSSVKKRKTIKTSIIAGCIAVALAIVGVLCFVFLFDDEETDKNYGFYLKDGNIFYTDYTEGGEVQLTEKFMDEDLLEDRLNFRDEINQDLDDYDYYGYDDYIGDYMGIYCSMDFFNPFYACLTVSENKERVFFADHLGVDFDYYGDSKSIYCKELKNPGKECIEIDSDICEYVINYDGSLVVYTKDNGELCISDLKDKETIAQNVLYFSASDDLSRIYYTTYDYEYYIWTKESGNVMIAEAYDEIVYKSEDGSEIFYQNEGSLYRWTENSGITEVIKNVDQIVYTDEDASVMYCLSDDKLFLWTEDGKVTKIDSDVYEIFGCTDTGKLYYGKDVTPAFSYMNFVEDDMAADDAKIEEPDKPMYDDYPDEPLMWEFDSYDEYEEAYQIYEEECDEIDQAYSDAYDEYRSKLTRDKARKELKSYHAYYGEICELYYYDGKDVSLVTDSMYYYMGPDSASWSFNGESGMSIEAIDMDSIDKIKFSSVMENYNNADSLFDIINNDYINGLTHYYLVEGNEVTETEVDYSSNSWDSVENYIISDVDSVYYDQKVNFKNIDEKHYTADLYIDGKKIAEDVFYTGFDLSYAQSWYLSPAAINSDKAGAFFEGDCIYYYKNVKPKERKGTLYVYKDGDETKIAENVFDYTVNPEGEVLYLCDYDIKEETGDLYKYDGEKYVKLDERVTYIV